MTERRLVDVADSLFRFCGGRWIGRRMRFSFGTSSNHTLEEVGQEFSVTRERSRPDQG